MTATRIFSPRCGSDGPLTLAPSPRRSQAAPPSNPAFLCGAVRGECSVQAKGGARLDADSLDAQLSRRMDTSSQRIAAAVHRMQKPARAPMAGGGRSEIAIVP